MLHTKTRILVIEDHPFYFEGLSKHLKNICENCIIEHAITGLKGIEFLNSKSYDIAIIDMKLPDISGMEVIKFIKNKRIPIKIISNSYDYSNFELYNVYDLKIDAILMKDEDEKGLLKCIKEIKLNKQYFSPSIKENINKISDRNYQKVLTKTETAVLTHVIDGHTSKVIADKLFMSINTVDTHKKKIFKKFQVHNAIKLAVKAVKEGLI